jgi:uncharacterized protein
MPKVSTALLVKIASRCNLACDYCYVYGHADQSWRSQPPFMSVEHQRMLIHRVAEYVSLTNVSALTVIFHGGEPLLIGANTIVALAAQLRNASESLGTSITFSLQTNGALLDHAAIRAFARAGVWVSLSVDGGQNANDLHRLDHQGRSSFAATLRALHLLEVNRNIFGGIISVVDPRIPPIALFEFVASSAPPLWDLLLPDANHARTPPGRQADPTIYERWLVEAFDLWLDKYANLRVRLFDSLLAVCSGLSSETEMLGPGAGNILTIETDGTYHGHDVLKITHTGATALRLTLDQHGIADALASPSFQSYARLTTAAGLSSSCRACPELNACGGSFVPHRYSHTGFDNPSVYCSELLTMIRHARRRMLDIATHQ